MNHDDIGERKALEEFILDNDDLQKLEAEIGKFNIFEAIGMIRQEIRHSRFLAFLLNPSENHGLGDLFLKQLLIQALSKTQKPPISLIDIDVADLTHAVVQTEWRNIDIFVADHNLKLAITIENKVDSEEHSNQLVRYRDIVLQSYPNYDHIFIFLSPDEGSPSDEDYVALSYSGITKILKNVLETRETLIGPDVRSLIEHYNVMLRRHIVSDSEIAQLSQKIYQRHKRALDLIFEHKPDLQKEIYEYLLDLIRKTNILISDDSSKTSVRFADKSWSNHVVLTRGSGWTRSGRILLFEFRNRPNRLALVLYIGPGPESVRQALLHKALEHKTIFKGVSERWTTKWKRIYSVSILSKDDLEDAVLDDIKLQIEKFWNGFLSKDLLSIRDVIDKEIDWAGLQQSNLES